MEHSFFYNLNILTRFMVDLSVEHCAKVHKSDVFGLFAPKKVTCTAFITAFEALTVIYSLKFCV